MAKTQQERQAERAERDAQIRVAAREALRVRLETFLDTQEGDGYGWPEVKLEDMREFYAIIGEIADLKFVRDCDGDQVLTFAVASRKEGRLIYAIVPHDPGCNTEGFESQKVEDIAWQQWFIDATRAAHLLIAQGSDLLRLIPDYMSRQNRKGV